MKTKSIHSVMIEYEYGKPGMDTLWVVSTVAMALFDSTGASLDVVPSAICKVVDGAAVEVGLADRVGGGEGRRLARVSVVLEPEHVPLGPLRLTQLGPLVSEPAGDTWVSFIVTPFTVTLPVFWTTKV